MKLTDKSQKSRRDMLQWMAIAPAAAAVVVVGCGESNGSADVGSPDTGPPPKDGGPADTAPPPGDVTVTDTAPPPGDVAVTDTTVPDTAVDAGPTQDANVYGTAEPDTSTIPLEPPENCELTPPDVQGPFYAANAPFTAELAGKDEPGERILIRGTVMGKDCFTPLAGVVVDVWQADTTGNYHDAGTTYRLRGQMTTGDEGNFAFKSIKPGPYDVGGALRPAHIHFKFHFPGQELTTQLYFEGDPFLAPNDPCGGCNSDEAALIIPLSAETVDGESFMAGTFDVNLMAS
jgi:catechol 1,2-dioxygenase